MELEIVDALIPVSNILIFFLTDLFHCLLFELKLAEFALRFLQVIQNESFEEIFNLPQRANTVLQLAVQTILGGAKIYIRQL